MDAERMLVGYWVAVRSESEILSTLDDNGTLDGLPFMPEMLSWCGKSFRIMRRVDRTCVADAGSLRRFPKGDVLILNGPRCDGNAHDGCKHGCRIFWKEAWLRPLAADDTGRQCADRDLKKLRTRLKVKSDEHHYFCQSTELLRSTKIGRRGGARERELRLQKFEMATSKFCELCICSPFTCGKKYCES